MNVRKLILIAAVAGLALAGCGGQETVPTESSASLSGGGNVGSGAQTSGNAAGAGGSFLPFEGARPGDAELLESTVIYFEFDSSQIRSDFNDMLSAHGRYLAATPGANVRLEGHADERGSREYNIGLGERRNQAVRQVLMLQGARASQITTVSYGEERPAVSGSDEEAYSLNRRVEFNYQ